MSRTTFVLAAAILLSLLSTGMAQVGVPSWKELMASGKEAFSLLKADDAIKHLDAALKAVPQEPLTLPNRIEMHRIRALAHELRQDEKSAIVDQSRRLGLSEELHGKTHFNLIDPLKRLARLSARTQDLKAAIAYQRRAIILQDKVPAGSSAAKLSLLHDLAKFQRSAGEHAEAVVSIQTYIDEISKEKGKLHSDLTQPLTLIADSYRILGNYKAAIAAITKRIAIFESVRKRRNDPSIASDLARIAELEIADARPDDAQKTCDRWRKILNSVTDKHPELWRLHEMQAEIARFKGDRKRESEQLREGIKYSTDFYGSTNVRVGRFHRKLSESLRAQNENEAAFEAATKAVAVFEKRLRAQDPQTMDAIIERGHCQLALGKTKAAATSFRKVLRAWEKQAGPKHRILRKPLEGLLKLAKLAGDVDQIKELKARLTSLVK
ncbi:MAG: hypothetical protein V3W41_15145 [Planctomycetota bacterium]